MIISPEQMVLLTGYKRPSAQIRALRRMGVRHVVRPDGRPVVDDSVLRGVDSGGEMPRFEDR